MSGCTHTDRELILVPKKGRPVTQCQHCRQERKKRSAHVRCDCGEAEKPHHPKEKCIHLREAEEKAKAGGFFDDSHDEKDPVHLAAINEMQGCCCPHGGKCSCALIKKEDAHDGSPPHGKPAVHKPRLESHKSEGSITVFANGHHKPVHRKNHAAHECGMPYKMPMSRYKQDHGISKNARRSMDNLSLNTQGLNGNSAMPPMPLFNTARRLSKSEQTSPRMRPNLFGNFQGMSDSQLATLDFAGLDSVRTNDTMHSATSESALQPMESMAEVAENNFFEPWSAFPSSDSQGMPNNNPFGVWPTTHDVSGLTQPALTAASSGTQSEVDEIPVMEDVFGSGMPSIQEDVGNVNVMNSETTNQVNRRSLPPNFFGNTDFSTNGFNTEWAAQFTNPYNTGNGKMKTAEMAQSPMFDSNAWQMPASQPVTSAPPRSTTDLPFDSNARSIPQSTGTATPPDDIMRSLFPEMDFDNTNFGAESAYKQGVQTSAPTANGVELETLNDQDMTFATQSWTDGSLSVPNDPFASPYAFPDDFTSQGYSAGWNQ